MRRRRQGRNLDLRGSLAFEKREKKDAVNVPAPPARMVLAIQLSIAMPMYRSILLFCSQSTRSASVNPGGKGSFPGAQMGTTKGRWEVIGLRVPEPTGCGGSWLILQVMNVSAMNRKRVCFCFYQKSYYIRPGNGSCLALFPSSQDDSGFKLAGPT